MKCGTIVWNRILIAFMIMVMSGLLFMFFFYGWASKIDWSQTMYILSKNI